MKIYEIWIQFYQSHEWSSFSPPRRACSFVELLDLSNSRFIASLSTFSCPFSTFFYHFYSFLVQSFASVESWTGHRTQMPWGAFWTQSVLDLLWLVSNGDCDIDKWEPSTSGSSSTIPKTNAQANSVNFICHRYLKWYPRSAQEEWKFGVFSFLSCTWNWRFEI